MLENLQFIESLYLPDYINVVFEYCNVKFISYSALQMGARKQNILRLSFPSRDCMLIFFVAKIFPVSREYYPSQKYLARHPCTCYCKFL